jgi:hypothetical protein
MWSSRVAEVHCAADTGLSFGRREHVTLSDLEALIANAEWFARCGQFAGEPDAVPLARVASADTWDWLPTSRDQTDPVHGSSLLAEAGAAGMEQARRDGELAVAHSVRSGLRTVPDSDPALVDGPHDFTPAARGGAEFAARMAAREVVVGRPGFWCRVVRLFAAGYWPCGVIAESHQLVVW